MSRESYRCLATQFTSIVVNNKKCIISKIFPRTRVTSRVVRSFLVLTCRKFISIFNLPFGDYIPRDRFKTNVYVSIINVFLENGMRNV